MSSQDHNVHHDGDLSPSSMNTVHYYSTYQKVLSVSCVFVFFTFNVNIIWLPLIH